MKEPTARGWELQDRFRHHLLTYDVAPTTLISRAMALALEELEREILAGTAKCPPNCKGPEHRMGI